MKIEPIWESQDRIISIVSDEFKSIEMRNPIVYHCMSLYRTGQLTLVGSLATAIKFLVIQNENMFKKLTEIYTSAPNVEREIK